ncbi:protein-L-isoaspartate(D-aspartate) O-methyltransferase [Ectothiorhodospira haloalkaliphila]|uniref:protein-L-isoaspartate(D-aspartate) O-methyltransferase n=1 Tax=Ectothiorhodospira haloalkaliphila TaxID=421628 RepID=UPI001EE97E51|nr:protein-L-isoaspartate(D-aspartate) O-methyltransferase [Ectothiorhodospira haloalkaliphila]MCG5524743.1 protein-L-isoaspartate(D-aspartate) O-methyltransferase [Ectothiorhodospira haloalkaliphila]
MKDPVARLIEQVRLDFKATADTTGLQSMSPEVEAALIRVPRNRFVPAGQQSHAWENTALPIGHQQTISQPFVVALMTQLLDLAPEARVLEVGTGCGYQTAILAELAREVFTIEVIPELAEGAQERLGALGYGNIHTRVGDGHAGWPEEAPFDAIIVTAGAPRIPASLEDQLRPGGRMVIPVNSNWQSQDLVVATRDEEGELDCQRVLAVRFVPLVGRES